MTSYCLLTELTHIKKNNWCAGKWGGGGGRTVVSFVKKMRNITFYCKKYNFIIFIIQILSGIHLAKLFSSIKEKPSLTKI